MDFVSGVGLVPSFLAGDQALLTGKLLLEPLFLIGTGLRYLQQWKFAAFSSFVTYADWLSMSTIAKLYTAMDKFIRREPACDFAQ